MRFPPSLLDDIRTRLPVSQVVARKVQLKRAGREWKGLSPFKVEKTPSFFVNDHKGFYKCFSSGEYGDIFTFVMKTEGLSFPEAVERLAAEAGVPLPKTAPRDRKQEDERTRLYALLEAAAVFFAARLRGADGSEARRYLEKRGLQPETITRFRLGYAPNSRSALREHLGNAGYAQAEMIAAGMLVSGDDSPVSYDRFRHRVMFPITDAKDRVIAFGGRALAGDQPAKYLNSPETPLFHKGALLYNAAKARPLAHERGQVIAVEGYMDVIALAQGGFGQTVAPLGTALTEAQLQLLWRMAPEPILCFDGDAAGRRAAFRAVDTVLPHLQPGRSVRFAFLDSGLDPDDLIRQQGPAAFTEVLAAAKPLFDVLFEREEKAGPLVTAEQLAALQTRLQRLVRTIADANVRFHYERELNETLRQRTRATLRALTGAAGRRGEPYVGQRRKNAQPDWRSRVKMPARPGHRVEYAAASNELSARSQPLPARETLLMRTLLNHPWLIGDHSEVIASLLVTSTPLARLRDALLAISADQMSLDSTTLRSHLESLSLNGVVELIQRAVTHKCDRFAEPDADRTEVEAGWRHTLALHERQVGLRTALQAAERAWAEEESEEALARICEIQHLIASVQDIEASAER